MGILLSPPEKSQQVYQISRRTVYGTDLLVFESIPWVAEDEVRGGNARKKPQNKMTEGEKIEQLIMTNPVYPKPSEVVSQAQQRARPKPPVLDSVD